MKITNLVTMSNQIGEFFESMPDRDQAVLDIALHLTRFWAPPMRRQLLESFERQEEMGLRPIVQQALTTHGVMLR